MGQLIKVFGELKCAPRCRPCLVWHTFSCLASVYWQRQTLPKRDTVFCGVCKSFGYRDRETVRQTIKLNAYIEVRQEVNVCRWCSTHAAVFFFGFSLFYRRLGFAMNILLQSSETHAAHLFPYAPVHFRYEYELYKNRWLHRFANDNMVSGTHCLRFVRAEIH